MVFDWQIYRELNPELQGTLKTPNQYIRHYIVYGRQKGLACSMRQRWPDFDWQTYKLLNPDLQFSSQVEYELHYIQKGSLSEKRLYQPLDLSLKYEKEGFPQERPDVFDWLGKILYINLASRPDRRQLILKQFERVGVPAAKLHRIDATFNAVHGAIGCSHSHVQALTYAIDNNLPNVLIFEDDINFIDDREKIRTSLEYLRDFKDYDVIQLTSFDFKTANFNKMLKKVNYCTMASGYIVNRPFMERLRANMQEGVAILEMSQGPGMRRRRHLSTLDHYWSRLQPSSRWYALCDRIVYQRKSYSDICKIIVDYKC
jgi:hypothetical protein